jgi:hypothetical protein
LEKAAAVPQQTMFNRYVQRYHPDFAKRAHYEQEEIRRAFFKEFVGLDRRGDVEASTVRDMGDVIATFMGPNVLPQNQEKCTTFFRLAYELSQHTADTRPQMVGQTIGILNKMADVWPDAVLGLLREQHGSPSSPGRRSAAQLLSAACPERARELQQLFQKVGLRPQPNAD